MSARHAVRCLTTASASLADVDATVVGVLVQLKAAERSSSDIIVNSHSTAAISISEQMCCIAVLVEWFCYRSLVRRVTGPTFTSSVMIK